MNVSSASVKNKVAANRAAVSKGDHKTSSLGQGSGGRQLPPFFVCLVETRLLGVIEAEQTDSCKTERNDRLIAVAAESHTNGTLKSLQKLDSKLSGGIEHFFISYNAVRCKRFKLTARKGPAVAKRLIRKQTKKRK